MKGKLLVSSSNARPMPRFEVLSAGVLVGHSDLESGDPPMGVATGKFLPLPAYDAIQESVVALREGGSQAHFSLTVRKVGGQELDPVGGVRISDYSAELGSEGLEVEALGIGYPLYGELFPDQVAAYRNYWAEKAREKTSNNDLPLNL